MIADEISIGRLRLDLARHELRRDGALVRLGSRALDILCVLAAAEGAVVTKDELMARVWPGVFVGENNIHVHISALRKALTPNGDGDSWIVTVAGRGYRLLRPPDAPAAVATPAPARGLAVPDEPSLAVLPFLNLSGDPDREYFADGIAEDIITLVSRYPSLVVIARSSSFTYQARAVDVKGVGRELGVRYVLEGALRRAGSRIRVTAQLVEAETGNQLWAGRYDGDVADIFTVQDEIASAVTIAIAPAIADAELRRAMRKPPDSLDAWAAYQRGLWHIRKATGDDNLLAMKFLQQAIDLDPTFSGAYTGLAIARATAADFAGRLAEAADTIEALARQAVALDPANSDARAILAATLYRRGDYGAGLAEAQRALATSPNLAVAHGVLGAILVFSGNPKQGLVSLERSIRLDPRGPQRVIRLNQIALGLYYCREYEPAVEMANEVIRTYPDYPHSYRWLAAALGQLGRTDEAKQVLAKAIAIAPAAFEMFVRQGVPWIRPEDHAHMLEGLHKAGYPRP
ncbi:MAG: winged helix-turn-helix domain-containing tetratricopeptide repeat protein [Stellaceae bacterium]